MESANFNMEPRSQLDIDIIGILSELIKNWWVILMSGCIAAMGTFFAANRSYIPVYRTSATMLVTARASAGTSTYSAYTDLTTAKQMADTFTYIMSSHVMLDKVAADLGISSVPGEISASVLSETNIMTLTVTSNEPGTAFQIMDSVLRNYKSVSKLVVENAYVEVLEAPQVPEQPVNSINMKSIMIKGFQWGAGIMILLMGIMAYMKDTVKTEKDISKKLDAALFATVPRERRKLSQRKLFSVNGKKPVLIANLTTGFQFTEAFRKIRTRLEYAAKKNNYKTIIITSTLEDEGKSTISANLAIALAKGDSRVLLIDGDLKNPSLSGMFNIDMNGRAEIGHVLKGKAQIKDAVFYDDKYRMFFLLGKSTYEKSSELLGSSQMENLLKSLANDFDYIIIDTPPVKVVIDAAVLTQYADASLLVVKQNYANVRLINDSIDTMSCSRAKLMGCIYNKVTSARISEGYGYGNHYKYGYKYQK